MQRSETRDWRGAAAAFITNVWWRATCISPATKVFSPLPVMRPIIHCLLLLSFTFLSGAWGAMSSKPEIFPNQEELILNVGEPLNLTCRAAHPVAWCTDHKFTDQNYEEEYREEDDKPYISTITIDAVYTSHVGYFSCVFNTTENKENNNCNVNDPSITSLYLYVKDLRHLMVTIRQNMAITTYVGKSVLLPCKPTFPEVNITLTKNYEPYVCEECYDSREGYTVYINESLTSFYCVGLYDDFESSFHEIYVQASNPSTQRPAMPATEVEGAWQVDTWHDDSIYYVKEGSNVTLTCTYEFKHVPPHLKLLWETPASNESGKHRIIRKYDKDSKYKSRLYEINNAELQDTGIYSCLSRIDGKSSDPSKLNISVVANDATYLSTNILHPNVTEVVDDRLVQWEIIFTAHPEPVFKWMRQGVLLQDSTKNNSPLETKNYEMKISVNESSLSLYLHHPTLTNNGMYTLEASLPGTNITQTTTMFLMIPGKPQDVRLTSNDNDNMMREGASFSLTCTAEGYPKPHLKLHFKSNKKQNNIEAKRVYNEVEEEAGTDEDYNTSMVKHSVHWMGVAKEPGRYWCEAENPLGKEFSNDKLFYVTDGEMTEAMSLELEIDGEVHLVGKAVTVVEGDDFKLTCRANEMHTRAPLSWTLNNDLLDETNQQTWNMEVTEERTRLSLLSTVRSPRLHRDASSFSLTCQDKAGTNKSIDVHVQKKQKPEWIGNNPGKNYDKNKNENLTLSCLAKGTPQPKVIWKKEGEELKHNNRRKINNHQLVFDFLSTTDDGRYTCEVSNRAGNLIAVFNVAVSDPDDQTMIIMVVVGVLIMTLVVLSAFFCRKIYQARKETLNLQLREQKMFMEGDPSNLNPDISLEQQAELLPYNTKYEVSRDSIIFDKLLGAGAFGRVYRATALNLLPGEARTTVAVKMMKSRTDCAQLKSLRSEVKIMIHIGRHANIVNLLGACSKDLASKGELLLLVEYCKHGNILDYMRRHRREFVNQINEEDKIDPTFSEPRPRHRSDSSSRSHTSRGLKYANLNFHQDKVFCSIDQGSDGAATTSSNLLPPCRTNSEAGCRPSRARTMSASSTSHHVASDNSFLPSETSASTSDGYLSAQSLNTFQPSICSTSILEWSYQIAKGMEYLAFKKVLHGDLAARNVLLAENNVVKISDFGLAKDIYKNDYKKASDGPMPVKWLAVECLREGVFSTQSDVWSFGVVLWEIFTLGQIPYSCSEFDENFIRKLEKGVRLEQPRYATYELYRIMLDCWNSDPMERPSFTRLEISLGEMLGETQKQKYLQLTEPYQDNGSSEFLDLLPSQDYSAKVRQTTPSLTEDGYEMPFSPGMAPQPVGHGDRLSTASRLTSRQMEYFRSAEGNNSPTSYVPMSADRTDTHAIFDFDNEAVASIMGRPENQENDGQDIYLKMDKTPQHSPAPQPDTPDSVFTRHKVSPRRIVLNSVSSQGSQRDGYPEVRKHDSGVYSPTVLAQTNPGYMTMGAMLSTDENNYVNTEASEANSRAYAKCGPGNHKKSREYLADGKCNAEYINLLPQDSGWNRAESETSSGVGSIEGGSPPRGTETDKLNVSPIPEEVVVV